MNDWQAVLRKLVECQSLAQENNLFPLMAYKVAPSSSSAWEEDLPFSSGLHQFYSICNGGFIADFHWLPLDQLSSETSKWIENLANYDERGSVLTHGKHLVLPLMVEAHLLFGTQQQTE